MAWLRTFAMTIARSCSRPIHKSRKLPPYACVC